MRNFLKIAEGVNVQPLMIALATHPELWDQNQLRTTHPGTAHSAVSDILVWFNEIPEDPSVVIDDRQTIPYPAWAALPQLRHIIFDLLRLVEGVQLGRVIITRLPPGKFIKPHVDGGAPAHFYTRFQLAVQSAPGVLFHCGEETLTQKTGDLHLFDNTQKHSVVNNSGLDRIALIIDARCA